MEGVIDYLKRGLTANNVAIANYKDSVLNANEDSYDPIVKMEINAIAMLENENKQIIEAIKILSNHNVCMYVKCKFYNMGSCVKNIISHNEIGMCTEGKELND